MEFESVNAVTSVMKSARNITLAVAASFVFVFPATVLGSACNAGDSVSDEKKSENQEKDGVCIIVLLGAPGAGKGTVAQKLADSYNMIHFSTGNLLRDEVERGTELGKQVKAVMIAGGLVSDDLINKVVESNLRSNLGSGRVILLDGYPRTVQQAEFLDSLNLGSGMLWSKTCVVEIAVDRDVVVSRLVGRKVCEKCKKTFGPSCSLCDVCGVSLVKRVDDNKETVIRRCEVYEKETRPVSRYYSSKARLVKIDGGQPPEEVARMTKGAIDVCVKRK